MPGDLTPLPAAPPPVGGVRRLGWALAGVLSALAAPGCVVESITPVRPAGRFGAPPIGASPPIDPRLIASPTGASADTGSMRSLGSVPFDGLTLPAVAIGPQGPVLAVQQGGHRLPAWFDPPWPGQSPPARVVSLYLIRRGELEFLAQTDAGLDASLSPALTADELGFWVEIGPQSARRTARLRFADATVEPLPEPLAWLQHAVAMPDGAVVGVRPAVAMVPIDAATADAADLTERRVGSPFGSTPVWMEPGGLPQPLPLPAISPDGGGIAWPASALAADAPDAPQALPPVFFRPLLSRAGGAVGMFCWRNGQLSLVVWARPGPRQPWTLQSVTMLSRRCTPLDAWAVAEASARHGEPRSSRIGGSSSMINDAIAAYAPDQQRTLLILLEPMRTLALPSQSTSLLWLPFSVAGSPLGDFVLSEPAGLRVHLLPGPSGATAAGPVLLPGAAVPLAILRPAATAAGGVGLVDDAAAARGAGGDWSGIWLLAVGRGSRIQAVAGMPPHPSDSGWLGVGVLNVLGSRTVENRSRAEEIQKRP